MSLSLRKIVVSAFAAAVSLGTFAGVVNHIPNGSFENETVVADYSAKYGKIGEKNHTAGWTAGGNAWLTVNNTPYCINGMGVIGTYCLALQDGAVASNSFTLAESGFYRLTLRKGVRSATTTACELTVAIDDAVVDISTNSNTKLPLSCCAPCVLASGDHKLTLKAVAVTGSPILNVDDLVLERVAPDCEAVGDDACMSGGEAVKGAMDTIRMFTIESKTYPLTVKRDTYVEMLVVGGGGGGGSNMGRGGGAGAVVYRVNQLMPAGEYEITVANGGGLDGDVGSNGGTTTVTRVDGEMRTDFIVAPGGGGGGNWNKYGRVGACGGGGGNGQAFRGEGCGFGGGGSTGQTDGGGGGGVGSIGLPGGDSTATAGAGFGGAGGKGVSCAITGMNEFYGWGGGGSAKNVKDGGASGGAGDSLGYGHGTDGSGAVGAGNSKDGRPNHGGGGGGSMGVTAGVGGSGVVIGRDATPAERADGAPDVTTFTQERIGSQSARLGGRLLSLGGATSASVKILYGTAADQLTSEKSVGVLDAAGDFSVTIRQLSLLADYWYCFSATANGKTTHSDVRHFKTQGLAAAEWSENAVVTTNGLYEIIAFTNGEGTVTFRQAGAVDILLVGGGGGGQCSDSSWCGGGGGGGGGVVYREGFVPEVGETYSVVVGAGGVGGRWGIANGGARAGTDSALILGSDDVYRAKGGGAGGGRGASGGGVGGNGAGAATVWNSNWMQG